jgi:hypothetical protein
MISPCSQNVSALVLSRILLVLLATNQPALISAQSVSTDFIEQVAEKLSETTTQDADLSDQSDDLEFLANHPLNINRTSFDELHQLSFLSEGQIDNLFLYIRAYGTVYSVSELLAVEGFDSATIQMLIPYVRIGDPPGQHPVRCRDLFSSGRNELIVKYRQVMQRQQGYAAGDSLLTVNPNAGYMGTPGHYAFRYKYTFFDRINLGLAGEKDPGEQFFGKTQPYGMDYYCGYLALMNTGVLKSLVIGNFRAGFGQGLVLGSGISFTDPLSGKIRRTPGGIRTSLSTNETGYLRGIAGTVKLRSFEFAAFFSGHAIDANPSATDSTGGILQVSSIDGEGYHRVPNEISKKNLIRERILGGNISFRKDFFCIGVSAFHSHWNAMINPRFYAYNKYTFRGKENLNVGADFQLDVHNVFLFGEIGRSRNGGIAWLLGGQFSPDARMSFSLLFRNYQEDYQDLLCNAIGRNDGNANEQGVLFTANIQLFPGFLISGYADMYRFPWLKYQVDFASQGSEFRLQGDYTAAKYLMMHFRFRLKTSQENTPGLQEHMTRLEDCRSLGFRYQADWSINPSLALKTRLEFLGNKKEIDYRHDGYLVSQSLSWRPIRKPCSVSVLYALFDTDTYDERIYAYENDVLYGYSVPASYGKGARFCVVGEWSPVKILTLWIKYGQTTYSDRNVIGTGLDIIDGNVKSEITVQLRVKL